MTLRVIGGMYKGRLLKAPQGDTTRPTLAILRKAAFDMLQPHIVDARVLDLFAGSGLIGIEALSRGATHVTFIDKNRNACACIRENLRALQLEDRADLFTCDAQLALKKCAQKHMQFDIIYIDPPYALSQTTPLLSQLLHFIDTHALLALSGTLLVEETTPPTPQSSYIHLRYIDGRTFGSSVLHRYCLK